MPSGFPRFRLYQSNGTTLVYEFENVVDDTGSFTDPTDFVEHTSLRGQGSIIIEGSEQPFDITLNFVLTGEDYEDLVAQMDSLNSTIDKFTKYILKIDLTISTTKDYKVMRLQAFEWPLDFRQKRVKLQRGIITLRANCWS